MAAQAAGAAVDDARPEGRPGRGCGAADTPSVGERRTAAVPEAIGPAVNSLALRPGTCPVRTPVGEYVDLSAGPASRTCPVQPTPGAVRNHACRLPGSRPSTRRDPQPLLAHVSPRTRLRGGKGRSGRLSRRRARLPPRRRRVGTLGRTAARGWLRPGSDALIGSHVRSGLQGTTTGPRSPGAQPEPVSRPAGYRPCAPLRGRGPMSAWRPGRRAAWRCPGPGPPRAARA